MPYMNPSAWLTQQKQQQPGAAPGATPQVSGAPQDAQVPSLGTTGAAVTSANPGGTAGPTPGTGAPASGAADFPAIQQYLSANQGQGQGVAGNLESKVGTEVGAAQKDASLDQGAWQNANQQAQQAWQQQNQSAYQQYLQQQNAARQAAGTTAQQAWDKTNPYPTGTSPFLSGGATTTPIPGSGSQGGNPSGSGSTGGSGAAGGPSQQQQDAALAAQQAAWNAANQSAYDKAYQGYTAPAFTPTTAQPAATTYAPSSTTLTAAQQAAQDLAGLQSPAGLATEIGQGYGGGYYAPGMSSLDAAIAAPSLQNFFTQTPQQSQIQEFQQNFPSWITGNTTATQPQGQQWSSILAALQNPGQPTLQGSTPTFPTETATTTTATPSSPVPGPNGPIQAPNANVAKRKKSG